MEITLLIRNGKGRIAYFCPYCGDLIDTLLNSGDRVFSLSNIDEHRALLDTCVHSKEPYFAYWKEDKPEP